MKTLPVFDQLGEQTNWWWVERRLWALSRRPGRWGIKVPSAATPTRKQELHTHTHRWRKTQEQHNSIPQTANRQKTICTCHKIKPISVTHCMRDKMFAIQSLSADGIFYYKRCKTGRYSLYLLKSGVILTSAELWNRGVDSSSHCLERCVRKLNCKYEQEGKLRQKCLVHTADL